MLLSNASYDVVIYTNNKYFITEGYKNINNDIMSCCKTITLLLSSAVLCSTSLRKTETIVKSYYCLLFLAKSIAYQYTNAAKCSQDLLTWDTEQLIYPRTNYGTYLNVNNLDYSLK